MNKPLHQCTPPWHRHTDMRIFTSRPATPCPARRTVVARMATDQSAALSAVERTAYSVASKRALEAQRWAETRLPAATQSPPVPVGCTDPPSLECCRALSLVCDPVISALVPGDPWWPQLEASQQAELADLRLGLRLPCTAAALAAPLPLPLSD